MSREPEQPDRSSRAGRTLVLLCTYNERHNLPDVLEGLWRALPETDVLVMDDNSPDGTGRWATEQQSGESRLHVVTRSGKLGLGSALREGMRWCLEHEHEYDFMINFDADQSHDPAVASQLLAACETDPARNLVAIGSRYVGGGASTGLTAIRQGLSRALNSYATMLLRLPVRDCSGSFRCYPTRLLKQLDLDRLQCNGYGFLEEVLVRLQQLNARFIEVPITYHARGSGSSKLSLSDAWGALAVIHRLAIIRSWTRESSDRSTSM